MKLYLIGLENINQKVILEKIKNFLTSEGRARYSEDELKERKKEVPDFHYKEFKAYYSALHLFFLRISPEHYYYLPFMVLKDLKSKFIDFTRILTVINTIKTVYQDKKIFEKRKKQIQQMRAELESLIRLLFSKYLEDFDEDVALSTEILDQYTSKFEAKEPNLYYNDVQIWGNFHEIIISRFEKQKIDKTLKNIGEFEDLDILIDQICEKNTSSHFYLKELKEQALDRWKKQNHNVQTFNELIYYLYSSKQVVLLGMNKIKGDRGRGIQQLVLEYIKGLYLQFLHGEYPNLFPEEISADLETSVNLLNETLLEEAKHIEEKLTEEKNDIMEASNFIEERTEHLFDIVNEAKQWFLTMQMKIKPFDKTIRRWLMSVNSLDDQLNRRIENFKDHAYVLDQAYKRKELDTEIKENLTQIEEYLEKYEKTTANIVNNEIPALDKLKNTLEDFATNFSKITEDMADKFQKYHEKNLNLIPSIKLWEEEFSSLKNRTVFVISSLFAMLLEKFQPVIDMEQSFFKDLQEMRTNLEDIPLNFSIDLVMPSKMTEPQLRSRMRDLDGKINELDKLRELYRQERAKYKSLLENLMEEQKQVTVQDCVICYKPIDIAEEKFIRCNFCARMSHYTCAAWWLDKHNSCPVCNNNYTIPDAFLFPEDAQFDEDL